MEGGMYEHSSQSQTNVNQSHLLAWEMMLQVAHLREFVPTLISPLLVPIVLLLTSWQLWQIYALNQRDKSSLLPLPPGSMGLPIVGETINFIVMGVKFSKWRQKNYGNIFKTHILGRPTIRVIGSENVHRILMGEHNLVTTHWPQSTKKILGEGALSMSTGDSHRIRRRVLLKAFTHEALMGYVLPVQDIVRTYIQQWCDKGNVLAYPECKQLTFAVASKVLLGFEFTEMEQEATLKTFHELVGNLFSLPLNIPGTGFNKGLKAREILLGYIDNCVQRRRLHHLQNSLSDDNNNNNNSPYKVGSDALSIMLLEKEDGGTSSILKDEEIGELALELLFAGHETTASVACSTLSLLAQHPGVLDKAREELSYYGLLSGGDLSYSLLNEMTYVTNIVREVLRLLPPIGGGFREAIKTFQLGGFQIPKGWSVMYSIRETQENSWTSAEDRAFNPDRWNDPEAVKNIQFFPYGSGGRACAGKEFAKLMLKVIVIELIRGCSWKLLSVPKDLKYFPVPHPKDNMPTRFSNVSAYKTRPDAV